MGVRGQAQGPVPTFHLFDRARGHRPYGSHISILGDGRAALLPLPSHLSPKGVGRRGLSHLSRLPFCAFCAFCG